MTVSQVATSARLLVAPHFRLGRSGMALLTAGALFSGLLASRMGVRFDGFLDLSSALGGDVVPLPIALADQFVALPLAAAVAWLILRGFTSASFETILLSFGTMRVPLVLIAPIAAFIERPLVQMPTLFLISLAIVGFAWTLALLVSGLCFATGLRSGRLAVAVLCVTIAAEVASEQVLILLTGAN
jgi:hypothetical protein